MSLVFMASPLVVLLYYKYVKVPSPASLVEEQKKLCARLGMLGRVLIGEEGINGTVAGTQAAADEYRRELLSSPEFADVVFKVSTADTMPFARLEIKVRKEIVSLGAGEDLDPVTQTATHLSPEEWKRTLDEEDVVVFDVRNRYESEVGRFKGAILPAIDNFRELPAVLKEYADLKDKKVLMYCTGGIRCEKASALFKREGFKNVYQLEGGIVTYGERVGAAHWEGDCFVFDKRMMVPVGQKELGEPIGLCAHTGRKTRNVINCLHDPCHKILLVSEEAIAENPDARLCPACRKAGLTSDTADYLGSPARLSPKG